MLEWTSPYNLLWNPGSLSGSIISNLQAGEYTLTVTDVNNCQEVDTFFISERCFICEYLLRTALF